MKCPSDHHAAEPKRERAGGDGLEVRALVDGGGIRLIWMLGRVLLGPMSCAYRAVSYAVVGDAGH